MLNSKLFLLARSEGCCWLPRSIRCMSLSPKVKTYLVYNYNYLVQWMLGWVWLVQENGLGAFGTLITKDPNHPFGRSQFCYREGVAAVCAMSPPSFYVNLIKYTKCHSMLIEDKDISLKDTKRVNLSIIREHVCQFLFLSLKTVTESIFGQWVMFTIGRVWLRYWQLQHKPSSHRNRSR